MLQTAVDSKIQFYIYTVLVLLSHTLYLHGTIFTSSMFVMLIHNDMNTGRLVTWSDSYFEQQFSRISKRYIRIVCKAIQFHLWRGLMHPAIVLLSVLISCFAFCAFLLKQLFVFIVIIIQCWQMHSNVCRFLRIVSAYFAHTLLSMNWMLCNCLTSERIIYL